MTEPRNPLTFRGREMLQLQVRIEQELDDARRLLAAHDSAAALEATTHAEDLLRRLQKLEREGPAE